MTCPEPSAAAAPSTCPEPRELLRRMTRIRLFEERCLEAFSRGQLTGTTHTCIGQEASAVGVLSAVRPTDIVFSNHRGHGHFLAHGGDMEALAAEMMGRASGVCKGIGGSQHLHGTAFYSNGVLGSTVPCAAGVALAEQTRATGNVVVLFMGDGALGEGVVYETLNLAALRRLPLLFAVENNGYAQSTPIHLNTAGTLTGRFEAFGIAVTEVDTPDVMQVHEAAAACVGRLRAGQGPAALIVHTTRFAAHSKGDDTRPPDEIARLRARDPLAVLLARLDTATCEAIREEAAAEVERAFAAAAAAPPPRPDDVAALLWEPRA